MDTDTVQKTDRFTPLMIFASDHDFPAFAAEHEIDYKAVMGFYEGSIEESFVVNINVVAAIIVGGILRGQKTVLLLEAQDTYYGGHRKAYLVKLIPGCDLLDPDVEFIGMWRKVSTNEALHSAAWTCYPETGTYYVAKWGDG